MVLQPPPIECLECLPDQIDLRAISLDPSIDEQERRLRDHLAVLRREARRNDHVDDTVFILEQDEHGPFRRLGTLTDDDQTGCNH